MWDVRRISRAVGHVARAIPLARQASATVARLHYEQRIERFLVERSGLADARPDGVRLELARGPEPEAGDDGPAAGRGSAPQPDHSALAALDRSIPARHGGQLTLVIGLDAAPVDVIGIVERFRTKGYRCDCHVEPGDPTGTATKRWLDAVAAGATPRRITVPLASIGSQFECTRRRHDRLPASHQLERQTDVCATVGVGSASTDSLTSAASRACFVGAHALTLSHPRFATRDEVDETLRLIGETDVAMVAVPVTGAIDASASRARALATHLRAQCRRHDLEFDERPAVPDAVLDDFYAPGAALDGRCLYPFLHATVGADAVVRFCPFIRVPIGNMATDPLGDIWNAPRYRALRRVLVEQRLLPACRRCPHAELSGARMPRPVRIFTTPLPAASAGV